MRFTQLHPPRWVFPAALAEHMETVWKSAGLTADQIASIEDPARVQPAGDHRVYLPTPDFILGLTAAVRSRIYTTLAEHPENQAHRDPFRFPAGAGDEWLGDADFPPPVMELTRRLLYRRGGNECFSDHELVMAHLSVRQRGRYLKMLSRKASLLVQLRVPPGAQVEPLAAYWAAGRRSKDLVPLLQSLAARKEGGTVDIVHLLPPFARRFLYTYPLPTDNPVAASRDCHWTALNFHAEMPDDRLADLGFAQKTLSEEYYPVGGEPVFGDVIVLIQAGNQAIHSCVYLADNIVFTKNGAAFSIPWQLAELDQVVAFYSLGPSPLEIRAYRRRHL